MRGPIDYIIVGFEGNKFDGSILKSLADAIDSGVIGLVGLSAVVKGADGAVVALNIAESGDDMIVDFIEKYPTDADMVSQDDIDEIGELLEPDSAAGFIVVEQLWAKPLKKAILDANGFLIAEGRIHPEAAAELNAEGAK